MATRYIEGVDPNSDITISTLLTNLAGAAGPHQIPLIFDQDTGLVHYYDKVNAAARTFANIAQVQTFTNKTLTSPVITSPTISDATITGVNSVQAVRNTAAFDVDNGTTGSTLTPITGMSVSLVAGATYHFKVHVPLVVMTTNGGLKMAFKLTTATLTAMNARVRQSTDTDNTGGISTSFVTTTDEATWFDQKAVVYTNCEIEGTLIVGTAGTIAVEAAQNTAHADNTTIIVSAATMVFTRLA